MDVRHLGSRYSVLSAERRSSRVGLSAMAKTDDEVHRAHSMMNRVHHGAELMLDALVYRQPVQLTMGGGHIVTCLKTKYETRSCVLYAL